MREVVVDASAMLQHLLAPTGPVGGSFDTTVHVPELCDVEVAHVLRRLVLQRRLTALRATEAVADYRDLALERHRHLPLLPRILALRDNFTAYDAAYAALAEALGAPLLTFDRKLAAAVRAHLGVTVRVG